MHSVNRYKVELYVTHQTGTPELCIFPRHIYLLPSRASRDFYSTVSLQFKKENGTGVNSLFFFNLQLP